MARAPQDGLGLTSVLSMFREDIDRNLRLVGVGSVAEIDGSLLGRLPGEEEGPTYASANKRTVAEPATESRRWARLRS